MAVIAINQQIGSRGVELGRLVAERLAYRFLGRDDLVSEASRVYNVDPSHFLIIDERQPSFWERSKAETERLLSFLRSVLLREMAADQVVYVGSSGAHLLPECGCGLRVRLVGTFKGRVERVIADEGLSRAAAEKRVREHDREVRARAQAVIGVDLDDPAFYHLVVNTSMVPMEAFAEALKACTARLDSHHAEGFQKLRDAALAAQVHAALLTHPKFGSAQVSVQCARGLVRLNGPGLVAPWSELAERVARQIEGVHEVEVGAEEPPMPYRSE